MGQGRADGQDSPGGLPVLTYTYYNDVDPMVCAWVGNLIKAGLVPDGVVDSRSISEVHPEDLKGFNRSHFFCGIAGWELALQLAGWPPDEPVWTGSCPCQPYSSAGRGAGDDDPRNLWPHFRRLIAECGPPVVFGEQVDSKAGRTWLAGVHADLEALGFAFGAVSLPAASVGAPHIRQRLWWVAESLWSPTVGSEPQSEFRQVQGQDNGFGWVALPKGQQVGRAGQPRERADDGLADYTHIGLEITHSVLSQQLEGEGAGPDEAAGGRACRQPAGPGAAGFWSPYDFVPCADGASRRVEPGTFPLAHGIPPRVVRLRAYGNAIVPEVAAEFIAAYMEVRRVADLVDSARHNFDFDRKADPKAKRRHLPTYGPQNKRALRRLNNHDSFFLKVGATLYFVDRGGRAWSQDSDGTWNQSAGPARKMVTAGPERGRS